MSVANLRIVLVEPAGPRNLGSVARVMKNMGLHRLVLVNPQCDPQDPEALLMAVHATEILHQAETAATLPQALADCQRVIGTTGRLENYPPEWIIESPRVALPWLLEDLTSAIVFGPEDRGLSNAELGLCHRQVMIPTTAIYPSLNLAQAVGICSYELRLASLDLETQDHAAYSKNLHERTTSSTRDQIVSVQVLEGFYDQLKSVLLKIGYLQPHTSERKLSKFRALFNRTELTLSEVALLRGILRQLSWAKSHWG